MKKFILIFTTIISFSQAYGIEIQSEKIEPNPSFIIDASLHTIGQEPKGSWATLVKKYTGSLVTGSIIGALSGGCCAQIEKALGVPFPVILIIWFIFRAMRIELLTAIIRDAQKHKIDHNRSLIFNSAWIADWLTYCYFYRNEIAQIHAK